MIISTLSGYLLLIMFILALIFLGFLVKKHSKNKSAEFFCFKNHKEPVFTSAISIAASWIWAPALFISTQIAYEKGISGLFWFLIPNILALASFAFWGRKIREISPNSWNLPEFLGEQFNEPKIKNIANFTVVFYQFMAVIVQLVAGSYFINLFTEISSISSIVILVLGVVTYSLLSGFSGTIKTDILQYLVLFIGALLFLFFYLNSTETVVLNFAGISGSTNIFEAEIFFNFGLLTTITLFAGVLVDQQYWQRSFAIKPENIGKSFLLGSFLFGIIPLGLAFWGFLAAAQNIILPENIDPAFIGIFTMSNIFSTGIMMFVFIMFLAGLTSTLDSAFSAFSTLFRNNNISPIKKIVIFGLLSLVLSLILSYYKIPLKYLWWTFNGISVTLLIPIITALIIDKNKINSQNTLTGLYQGIFIGCPIFLFGQFQQDMKFSLFGIFLILAFNLWSVLRRN